MPHICAACGKPMAKTNQGFECQTVLCGFMVLDGHGAEYTEDEDSITINIKRDKIDMEDLSFKRLRDHNVRRCNEAFRPLEDWSPTDWGCAMAGETGEACNLLKKMRRGEDVPLDHVAAELADVVTYADLLAARLGIDLGAAVVKKFDIVSRMKGSDIFLGDGS